MHGNINMQTFAFVGYFFEIFWFLGWYNYLIYGKHELEINTVSVG